MRRWLKSIIIRVQSGFALLGRAFGMDSFRRKPAHHYVPDYFGRAAYKQADIKMLPLFGELATEVIRAGRSSLYYDRLYTIYQALIHLSAFVKPGQDINLAEVGVYKGGTSHFIASIADRLGLKATIHSFDTFEGHALQDISPTIDEAHRPGFFGDTSYEEVKKYLSPYENILVYKGRFQDTCQNIDTKDIHFVHLDVDIYDPTLFALKYFDQKLVAGGAILVDDYGFATCPGIEKAVGEFRAEQKSHYFGLSLLTGQYLLIKLKDQE